MRYSRTAVELFLKIRYRIEIEINVLFVESNFTISRVGRDYLMYTVG